MRNNAVVPLATAKDSPLAVHVPNATQDKPAWVKVGVIAAVGFVVGIAWPRVMGVRLGPGAPGEAAAAAAAASASGSAQHAGRAPEAPPASVTKAATGTTPAAQASSAPPATAAAVPPSITVPKGLVISCKTTDGETKKGNKDCGAVPGVDGLVMPRVRKIATCSGVEGQTGKLSLIVNADFASGRFWYEVGKSSTLQNMDAVTSCLKTSFHGVSTTATPHEHARYTVAYTATFAPGAAGAAGGGGDEEATNGKHNGGGKTDPSSSSSKAKDAPPSDEKKEASEPSPTPAAPSNTGEATVAWEVALVRDAPKTGGLVSRLPRGTKVKVGSSKDGWYQIKFGESFNNDGWVYRGAIGR